MPLFTVTYYDKDRQTKTLEFEQPDEDTVILFLKRQGIVPISIKRKKIVKTVTLPGFKKITLVDKAMMTRHLSTLIRLGTPLFDSVELLLEGSSNTKLSAVYRDMLAALEQGKLFSTVFEKHPKDFSPTFRSVIKVGEATGTLDQSFALLTEQLEKQRELQKAIKSATVYPIVLTFAVVGLVLLVLIFVIPRITQIFGSLGVKLPITTRILISMSEIFTKQPIVTFVVILAVIIVAFIASKPIKKILSKVAEHIPGIKKLIVELRLAQLARSLATMIKSGLPLLEALDIQSKGMAGTPYEGALQDVIKDVKAGTTLTQSMKKRPKLFPGMFVGMMRVGEKTATLDQILGHMAEFYEEEVDSSLKNLSTFIEPALLVLIGLIILLVAVSVLVPIYSLVSNII